MNTTNTHKIYQRLKDDWSFFLRSYEGGTTYQNGGYLSKYLKETDDELKRRIKLTPLDNHCKNIVHIYSSFLWRVPPTRNFSTKADDKSLQAFIKDADLDGRNFNEFMKQAQVWASIYGHCWVVIDKPTFIANSRATEEENDIRPYVAAYTPDNVVDWEYTRKNNGKYELTFFKACEDSYIVEGQKVQYYRCWYTDKVDLIKETEGEEEIVESNVNPLGEIPAVCVMAQRSSERGVGVSDIVDAAFMQKAIYEELSEIEQLIRISNHPTLVKSRKTDASAGAGGIINVDEEDQVNPYLLQPSAGSLTAIMDSIDKKSESISRMAHMGAVRGTQAITQSGVAMQTEFQILNAKLAEKAGLLELAEEQLWRYFCKWQSMEYNFEIGYPDAFDLRDYDKELAFLQAAKASGVKSATFLQEVDKQIADLILDDALLANAHKEIMQSTKVIGQFSEDDEE
jgi:hypothetical protein